MNEITPDQSPFARGWEPYREAGWLSPHPAIPGKKSPTERGITGHFEGALSDEDCARLARRRQRLNILLRLPDDRLGLDIDTHHDGHLTLAEWEAELGPLPPTVSTSKRGTDNRHGIYLFCVPPGIRWKANPGDGIEVIQHGHRSVAVWPSEADGGTYRWYDAGRQPMPDGIVPLAEDEELADLPPKWAAFLRGSSGFSAAPDQIFGREETDEWVKAHEPAEPLAPDAWRVPVARLEKAARGERHHRLVNVLVWIAEESAAGAYSPQEALGAAREAWRGLFPKKGDDRARVLRIPGEWHEALGWALPKASMKSEAELDAIRARLTPEPELEYEPEDQDGDGQDQAEPEGARPKKARKPRGDSQAKILLGIRRERFPLIRDENGEAFAIDRLAKANVAIPAIERGGGLRSALALAFLAKSGKMPSSTALASVMIIVEAEGAVAPLTSLPLRVARTDDGGEIWIDIGDATGRAVRVTPGEWTIEPRPPMPFRRTEATRPLSADKSAPGAIGPMRKLFHLSDGQWDFLVNWMVISFVPGIPHAVPVVLGGPGRAKTTLCTMVLELIDPSAGALSGDPDNGRDLRTHASGSWAIGLENVSAISRQTSDLLSQFVTGHQSRERAYYTNSQIKVVSIGRRVVILNGVAIRGIRQDLQSRCVNIHPEKITADDRLQDKDIDDDFHAARKGAISYLLDCLAAAMIRERDGLDPLDEMPRMADFAQWLAHLDSVRDTNTLDRFAATVQRDAIQSAMESPIGAALRAWLRNRANRSHDEDDHEPYLKNEKGEVRKDKDGEPVKNEDYHEHREHAPGAAGHAHHKGGTIKWWGKSASQWLINLPQPETLDGRRDWPSTARGFANEMRMIENGLELDGWTVRERVKDGRTVWEIGLPEPAPAAPEGASGISG